MFRSLIDGSCVSLCVMCCVLCVVGCVMFIVRRVVSSLLLCVVRSARLLCGIIIVCLL